MRMSLGAVFGVIVVVAVALSVPAPSAPWLRHANAQDEVGVLARDAAPEAPTLSDSDDKSEAVLHQRIDFDFFEAPLVDALEVLGSQVGLQFHLKTRALEDNGVARETPVSLSLRQVSVEMGLDLILEQLDLTYLIRDGVIVVTTAEELENIGEVRIYNCRDLVEAAMLHGQENSTGCLVVPDDAALFASPNAKMTKKKKRRAKSRRTADSPPSQQSGAICLPSNVLAQFGGSCCLIGPQPSTTGSHTNDLIDIIASVVEPDSWDRVGGPGTIAEFDGLMVIRQDPRVHRQIERILAGLRETSGQQPWTVSPGVSNKETPGTGGGGFF